MSNELKLRIMFDMIDKYTKPLRNILNGNKGLSQSLKQAQSDLKRTRGELAELSKKQQAVGKFRELRAGLDETAKRLAGARAQSRELAKALHASGPPSREMITELARARQAVAQLGAEHKRESKAVDEMRVKLAQTGIDTRKLSDHERTLRGSIVSSTDAMKAQVRQLEALGQREKRLAEARKGMQAMQAVAGGMAVSGYAARATGSRIFHGFGDALDEEKKMANERARITGLGLGDAATRDAETYVRAMHTMGVSTTENMTLMRDALSIFADEHHAQMVMPTLAKMKFANEAMFGAEQGHQNEEKFMNMLKVIELRGGTKSEGAFNKEANIVQQVLSATGGRVGGDEWRNFIQTGGVAAKQLKPDAFYYQMEPLIQEMGGHAVGTGLMSAYQNLVQGKTTNRAKSLLVKYGLLDPSKVKYDKVGNVKEILPGGLKGGDMITNSPVDFVEKVLLPQLAKHGITSPKAINNAIGGMITNRTGANLYSTIAMQLQQIRKSENLNRGAYGIDDSEALARTTPQGKELAAHAQLRDLMREMGQAVLPLYMKGLDLASSILSKLTDAIKAHPDAAKIILSTVAAFGALLVVGGTVTIVLAGILGPLALLRFSMMTLGIEGSVLRRSLSAGADAFRGLGRAGTKAGGLLASAFKASSPTEASRRLRRFVRQLGTAIPNAGKAAVDTLKDWGKTSVTSLRNGLVAARRYTRQVWLAVAAQTAAARGAVAGAWSRGRQYAGRRGIGGMMRDGVVALGAFLRGGALRSIGGIGRALLFVGQALLWIGAAVLTPVGGFIAALVAGALVILRYWEPIKAFFRGFWSGLREGLAPLAPAFERAFGGLKRMLEPLKPVFDWVVDGVRAAWDWLSKLFAPVDTTAASLTKATDAGKGFGLWLASIIVDIGNAADRFIQFGADLTNGLVNGIKSGFSNVKDAISSLADSTIAWFKEKLGIHSPSRVFASLGGFVSDGAAVGMDGGQKRVARAAAGLAAAAITSFGSPMLTTAATLAAPAAAIVSPTVPIDNRAPLAASSAGGTAAAGGATQAAAPVINIYPAAGADPQAIARAVADELDKRDRAQRARTSARLSD
ncbi:hypothetical protein [Burkholderia gladioli]|uniref:hypothetical protein n=1 Tax=Burkholderia gladioli TaxID=28095 RepID=UPI000D00AA74|nr:hypothetical protein [Burkholderia gladioli]PRH36735.1 hypothetical protein C6V07_07675 [Burkholderia gladioli]